LERAVLPIPRGSLFVASDRLNLEDNSS